MGEPIKIRLRTFAFVRQALGSGELQLTLPAGSTVAHLLEKLAAEHPNLAPHLGQVIVTINQQFAEQTQILKAGDEVGVFPPVSGGTEDTWVSISAQPIDAAELLAKVTEPGAGAVVTFAGVVRDNNLGRPVNFLEYEAYAEMAEAKMRQVIAEARQRWPKIRRVAAVHRVGRLELGEMAVLIAVGAPHRDDGAFETARYAIDRIKEIVPIWKKEGWSDGAEWLVGDYHPKPGE